MPHIRALEKDILVHTLAIQDLGIQIQQHKFILDWVMDFEPDREERAILIDFYQGKVESNTREIMAHAESISKLVRGC